jgi:hypothetical protein
LVLAVAVFVFAQPARAQKPPSKKECLEAYVAGQVARRDGKLLEAREKLELCSHESCPKATGKDCRTWREQLETQIPSVVFQIKDKQGKERSDVKVTLDGSPLVENIDGRAVPVDPGKHRFAFELSDHPEGAVELTVLEGVKSQQVSFSFEPDRPAVIPKAVEEERPVPIPVYVLGGIGVVGIAGFAYFGIKSQADASDLRSSCGPYCPEEDRDSVRTKQITADVCLAVGVVSLGIGTWLYLTRPSKKTEGRSLGVAPAPRGIGPSLRGTF